MECYCGDYEEPTLHNVSTRKARKGHICSECGKTIAAGEHYEYVSGMWEGCFNAFKTCPRCTGLREWVTAHVPCACYAHGNLLNDLWTAVDVVTYELPEDTQGLRFGFLRHMHAIKRPGSRFYSA